VACSRRCARSDTPPVACTCRECRGTQHGLAGRQILLGLGPADLRPARMPVDLDLVDRRVHVSPGERITPDGATMLGWIAHLPDGRRWGLTPLAAAEAQG